MAGSHEIENPHGKPLGIIFEADTFLWIKRCQVVKKDSFLDLTWRQPVYRLHFQKSIKAFVIFRRPDLARNLMTGPQVESLNLRRRYIDIVWSRQVVIVL